MEIENAVNQAKKELANRFDFKGSNAEITLEKDEIKLSAEDQNKIHAVDLDWAATDELQDWEFSDIQRVLQEVIDLAGSARLENLELLLWICL